MSLHEKIPCAILCAAGQGGHRSEVDVVLARLGSCVSRDLCDELAVNFCYVNSKVRFKHLSKHVQLSV